MKRPLCTPCRRPNLVSRDIPDHRNDRNASFNLSNILDRQLTRNLLHFRLASALYVLGRFLDQSR